jgi:hypothetical protein
MSWNGKVLGNPGLEKKRYTASKDKDSLQQMQPKPPSPYAYLGCGSNENGPDV